MLAYLLRERGSATGLDADCRKGNGQKHVSGFDGWMNRADYFNGNVFLLSPNRNNLQIRIGLGGMRPPLRPICLRGV